MLLALRRCSRVGASDRRSASRRPRLAASALSQVTSRRPACASSAAVVGEVEVQRRDRDAAGGHRRVVGALLLRHSGVPAIQ